jgi:hypothetical protein
MTFVPYQFTKQQKLSQLPHSGKTREVHAYYCILCEEILALSKPKIEPRKITLVFANKCPGCGFRLEQVLRCEIARVSVEIGQLMHPKISDLNCLFGMSSERMELRIGIAQNLQTKPSLDLTGISQFDKIIKLGLGQFAVFHGKATKSLSSVICVRATMPQPLGLNSDIIFLDSSNIFDAYTISEYAIRRQVNSEKALARIHLSRAFTYHQLSTLINEKLPHAIDRFKAKLVVISDITALYCDQDVARQQKQESLDIFRRDVRMLTVLAEKKKILIIATNLQSRNKAIDTILLQTAPISVKLEEYSTFTRLTLIRHPFTPQLIATIFLDKETLESYI